MRPLQLVSAKDLEPGKMYLIQEKRPEYAHLNSKGIFVKNKYYYYSPTPRCSTISHFTNVTTRSANRNTLKLQDAYWNYYKADAIERSYITQALRVITGDPNFIFDQY
jgi:hypothetical protein